MIEKRTVEQVRIFGLILNTFGRAEEGEVVALATNEQALKDFYDSQFLDEPETENNFHITFKEGPFRFNNPLSKWGRADDDSFRHGWFDQWVDESNIRTDIFKVDF